MEEIVYKNKFYIIVVTIYISFLLLKNGVKMFAEQDILAAATLVVQAIVLYQIKLKDKYVKLGIKTWTFFPIAKEGTLLVIAFLFWVSGGSDNIVMEDFWKSVFFFSAAVLIYAFCDRSIGTRKKNFV
ncbi:MAG: hypothetical protein AB8F94_09645 [Saprospiraceae bacterium]